MNDTAMVELEQVQKHRSALEQVTSQIEEIGNNASSADVAQMCRSIAHASRFALWLCDHHGIAVFPDTWKQIASDTWEDAKAEGIVDGFSRDEHMEAVRSLVAATWPNGRVTNINIQYIGGNA